MVVVVMRMMVMMMMVVVMAADGSIIAPTVVYYTDVSGWEWEAGLCRVCQDAFESVKNIGE